MIIWFIYLFEILFKIYMVVNFIEKPSQKNFLLVLFLWNNYVFGYLWSIYIIFLLTASFTLKHKQLFNMVCSHCFETLTETDELNTRWNLVQKYFMDKTNDIKTIYQRPIVQRYISLIKKYGSCTLIIIKYGTIWIIKVAIINHLPSTLLNKLCADNTIVTYILNDDGFLKNGYIEIQQILKDLEILEQFRAKMLTI